MDLPPSATIPVYTDKVFVKALRLPNSIDSLEHKNDDIFQPKAPSSKNLPKTNSSGMNIQKEKIEVKKENIKEKKEEDNTFGISADLLDFVQKDLKSKDENQEIKKEKIEAKHEKASSEHDFDGFVFNEPQENSKSKNNSQNHNYEININNKSNSSHQDESRKIHNSFSVSGYGGLNNLLGNDDPHEYFGSGKQNDKSKLNAQKPTERPSSCKY